VDEKVQNMMDEMGDRAKKISLSYTFVCKRAVEGR
jgi:hypothetical protein